MSIRGLPAALFLLWECSASRVSPASPPTQEDPSGTWVAHPAHAGETSEVALSLERTGGTLQVKWSTPSLDIWDLSLGPVKLQGNELRIEAIGLSLTWDRSAQTLSGTLPAALVPVYSLQVVFHPSPPLQRRPRVVPDAPVAQPVWVFEAGAPIWGDATYASGAVLIGADDGKLHALDAHTGRSRWSFRAAGAIRARPAFIDGEVVVQADDGQLYKLDPQTGKERSHVRVGSPTVRLPPADRNSRYENRASAVSSASGRLYLGTHDGRVLALAPASGWEFKAGDSVTSTPLVVADRLYFGSFDGHVYALDATTGALVWKRDTGAAVTSSPAYHKGLVIVGSRSYDLLALDAQTGQPVWTRYYWFSWVESPATVFDGVVYTGSSDAAKLLAWDASTGRRIWELDMGGSAWGQPAVTQERVYEGAVGTLHYLVPHRGSLVAADRRTGRPVWRYPLATPEGPSREVSFYGFVASPAVGDGLVFFGGLDGRVYAFAQ